MNSVVLPLSLAILHFNVLPNNSFLFKALTQVWADSFSKKRTKASPLLLCVSLSFTVVTLKEKIKINEDLAQFLMFYINKYAIKWLNI